MVSGANGTQSYTSANELNQYPSITPIGGALTTIAYDANGNLTSDGVNTFSYDPENRLLSVSGGASATYAYDALDRRMSKTTGGVTTRYLQAGSDEIAEYNSSGTLLRRFVPGPGTDERAVWIESASTSPPATALNFPHTDRLGSVLAITSSTGAVTARYEYNAWGGSNSSTAGYPFRYTGQRLDPETGLMFYKARIYSMALGRFLQTDPIGTKDDLNLYGYSGNDPVNKTDPSGKEMAGCCWLQLPPGTDIASGTSPDFANLSQQDAISYQDWTARLNGSENAEYAIPGWGWGKSLAEFQEHPTYLGGAFLVVGGALEFGGPLAGAYFGAVRSAAAPLTAADRVAELANKGLTQIQRERFVTLAVTETKEGIRIISSSSAKLEPSVVKLLQEGEIGFDAVGHAEPTGVAGARFLNLTPTGVAASRPICVPCATFLEQEGIAPLTPLKD